MWPLEPSDRSTCIQVFQIPIFYLVAFSTVFLHRSKMDAIYIAMLISYSVLNLDHKETRSRLPVPRNVNAGKSELFPT